MGFQSTVLANRVTQRACSSMTKPRGHQEADAFQAQSCYPLEVDRVPTDSQRSTWPAGGGCLRRSALATFPCIYAPDPARQASRPWAW